MQIALIMPHMIFKGGAQNAAVWLAAEMGLLGHRIEILTDHYNPDLWPQYRDQVKVREIEVEGLNRADPAGWKKHGKNLVKALESFDVVNPHICPAHLWLRRALLARPKAVPPPLAWYCHEPYRAIFCTITDPLSCLKFGFRENPADEARREADRDAAALASQILVNSRYTAGNVQKVYGRESRVCYPGIPVVKPLKIERRNFRLVTRLSRQKNVDTVIQAMALVERKYGSRGIRLQVAGTGPESQRLKEMAEKLNLYSVQFVGYLPDNLLPEFYAGALAMIYIPLDEPFGLVPLEAGMQKTPVIGSNQGGLAETVLPGVTGLAVDPLDPRQLAEAMINLHSRPQLAQSLGEAGHQMVHRGFTSRLFAQRYAGLIEGLIKKKTFGDQKEVM